VSIRVLEHVVRRASLAVRLSDLATGLPVHDAITVTAWPSSQPNLVTATSSVTAAGVAGFPSLPGVLAYEDGSTPRDAWFSSPLTFAPEPFVVRVHDTSGTYLRVVRELMVPSAVPIAIALPRSPSSPVPSGSLSVVATIVTQTGEAASWAVVELTVGSFVTGGVADARGVVVVPVPRAVSPTATGSASGGPTWRLTARVRFRPADHRTAPGAATDDPPTISSLLAQQHALVNDGGALAGSLERDLTTGGPLVLASRPSPDPSVLVVRPSP
jgi:hypothetical protein